MGLQGSLMIRILSFASFETNLFESFDWIVEDAVIFQMRFRLDLGKRLAKR